MTAAALLALLLTVAPPPVAPVPPAPLTPETLAARYFALPPEDHDAAVALAEEALEAGFLDETEIIYRRILDVEPRHEVAYYALWHLVLNRPVAKASPAYERARQTLPETFVEHETRFYVVLSDADPAWVREQGERLELAFDRFIRFANELDLMPQPPRHKLVAVVFNQRDQFQAFARTDGNGNPGIIAGYYSLPNDRLVFFHAESSANVAAVRNQLTREWDDVEATARAARRARMTNQRETARDLARDVDRARSRLAAEEDRIAAFARERNIAVTVHEAIHQLMFHTKIQSLSVQHPMWLTEGLATAFETSDPRRLFGPREDYPPRRDAFRALLARNGQLPLRKLLGLSPDDVLASPRHIDIVYHQGYALVTWLARHRRPSLRRYLLALNELPPGVPTMKTQQAVFESSFGDIDRLEEAWLRAERASG